MTLWVFGYGSLLWNPGFVPVEARQGRLDGWHRSFCMLSIHHRGTVEHPGLVLALDAQKDARCTGMVLRVAEEDTDEVLAYLRERELVSAAYLEVKLPVTLDDGREIEAVTYVIDAAHAQYVDFDLETQAQMIASAVGGRGPNTEYLYNTTEHLAEIGLHDPDREWLSQRVRSITA